MSRLLGALAVALVLASLLVTTALAVDGDIVFKRKPGEGGETPPAVFPHWAHRIRFKCYACHPSIVEMKAGANAITMDAISGGKFCGVCHNGKIAWEVGFNTCPRCHVEQ
jgi:c(7)-type cytochrome triheme protein